MKADGKQRPMTQSRIRRFGLLDLMIVVAAIALGLAPLRFLARAMNPPQGVITTNGFRVMQARTYAVPSLIAFTLAALVRFLIPPRPPLRRLARQPGFLACAVAVACLVVIGPPEIIGNLYQFQRTAPPRSDFMMAHLVGSLAYPTGITVAGAWLGLVSSGRWRAAGDHLDRIGQALGVAWISLVAAGWTRFLF